MKLKVAYRTLAAIAGWGALVLQLYLLINLAVAKGESPFTGIAKFFDYFTILSNLLVAIAFTRLSQRSDNAPGAFFTHPQVKTGITLYILVTGLVYFFLLRNLWSPVGLQWLADVLLHYVMPIAFVVDWLLFTPRGWLQREDVIRWLIVPVGFGLWALFWGAIFGFYPYPFIDVTTLGYPQVFLNILLMLAGFFVLGLGLVAVDRWLQKGLGPKW